MGQIKYLINAFLLLLLGFIAFALLKPFASVPLISDKVEENNFFCGTSSLPSSQMTTTYPEGKTLFQQNCQTCHALDKHLTGPALRGFTERGPWSKKENIYKWIHNPAAFMARDKYTQELKEEYGVTMQAFPQLTNDQINAIVSYVSEPPSFGY